MNANTQVSFKPKTKPVGNVLCAGDIMLKKVEHILEEIQMEVTEATLPANRRGMTLRVFEIKITLEDGSVETWNFPGGDPAYYREGRNRVTKPDSSWKTHELWWHSEKESNDSHNGAAR